MLATTKCWDLNKKLFTLRTHISLLSHWCWLEYLWTWLFTTILKNLTKLSKKKVLTSLNCNPKFTRAFPDKHPRSTNSGILAIVFSSDSSKGMPSWHCLTKYRYRLLRCVFWGVNAPNVASNFGYCIIFGICLWKRISMWKHRVKLQYVKSGQLRFW